MTVTPTPFSPDVAEITFDELSEEERDAILKRAKALNELLKDDKIKARYKLEIRFGKKRNVRGLVYGMLSFWMSGKKLHGGGDSKLYLCPFCEAVVLEEGNAGVAHYCNSCGRSYPSKDAIGEKFYNLPIYKWAEVLHRYYIKMGGDCDIYLKYTEEDIRFFTEKEISKTACGDVLDPMRWRRKLGVYPLENIIKDLNGGADLVKRFKAFLTA